MSRFFMVHCVHFTPEMQIITHIKHSNTTSAVGYQQLISLSRDVKLFMAASTLT